MEVNRNDFLTIPGYTSPRDEETTHPFRNQAKVAANANDEAVNRA